MGSWLVLILSILTAYANYNEIKDNIQMASFFNSDTLGMPSLYKDLIIDHNHFKDWVFATAPTIFPDITLYFLLAKTLPFGFTTIAMIYGLIQVASITWLCIFIYSKLVPEKYIFYRWLIPLFFAVIFMESFYFSNDIFFGFLFLSYSFHVGSFLNSLIFLAILISRITPVLKYIILFLFSALAVFSDKLFLVTLVLPLALTLIVTLKQTKDYRSVIVTILIIGAGTFAALRFYNYVNEHKFATFQSPHAMYAFKNIGPSIKMFGEQMAYYLSLPGFRSFSIIFTFFSVFFILFYLFKRYRSGSKNEVFLATFFFFFTGGVLLAPLINGNYTGWDTLRYNIAAFFFSSVSFTLFVAVICKGNSGRRATIISGTVLVFFLVLVLIKFSAGGLKGYVEFYPSKVAEIDSVAKQYNLKRGIAEYWTAKKTTMFSKNNVKIFSVYDNSCIQDLGANINWFFDKEFDFIIADRLVPGPILQKLVVKDTVQTAHYTILIMDHFTFPRGIYCPEKMP